MGITNLSALNANLGPAFRGNDWVKYRYTEFQGPVLGEAFADVSATPDLVEHSTVAQVGAGDINTIYVGGYPWQYFVNGAFAGQAPQVIHNANGLALSIDAANDDGIEFAPILAETIALVAGVHDGSIAAPARTVNGFTARTDDMFLRVRMRVEDVSALDFLSLGFRRANQLPQTTLGAYTDYFVMNLNNGTSETRSRLNSGTESVTVSTETVADAGTVIYEVRVNRAGVAQGLVNGALVAAGQSGFTFDSADLLIPFFLAQADGTDGGAVELSLWEQGTFDQRQLVSLGDLVN